MRTARLLLLIAATSALPLGAQKLPDPEDAGLTIELHPLAEVLAAWKDTAFNAGMEIPVERLGLFARRFAHPALAAGEDARVLGGRYLVTRARPEQQAWIHRWLQRIAASPSLAVHLELRFASVPQADFAQHVRPLLAAETSTPPDTPEGVTPATHGGVLSAEAHATLMTTLDATGSCDVLHAPSILVNEFQRANMSSIQQRSYVTGFEPAGNQAQQLFTPVIDTLQLGLELDAAATLLPDGGVGLRLAADHRELVAMNAEAWSPHHPDLRIQVPDVHRGRVDTWVTIPAEHHAIFAVPNAGSASVLLVMARAAVAR